MIGSVNFKDSSGLNFSFSCKLFFFSKLQRIKRKPKMHVLTEYLTGSSVLVGFLGDIPWL